MPKEAWFDLERHEAVIPWPKFILSFRQIGGFTAAMVGLILIAAVVDGRELTPYLKAVLYVAVLVPLGLMLVRTLGKYTDFNTPVGISPTAMAARGWLSGIYFEWSEVRALVYRPPMIAGRYEPPTSELFVILKDDRRDRVRLPCLRPDDVGQLVAILNAIARRHGFELVVGHTEDGDKRARQLGA
ncbi:hypothetical protein VQ045_11540 [Aurantimonas sp. E1-2-R+4]|uniref:hypothetical protein n=1 Tax=Aurantimonas sp. E1-2-R+4 TaxID=3113714 RepID=UPI002F932415